MNAPAWSRTSFLNCAPNPLAPKACPRENRKATASLEAIAAHEPRLTVLQVAEPGDVEPAGAAVVQGGRLADQVFHEPRDPGTHHVLAEVVAHVPARVAGAVGMLARARQEQQAGGFERRGCHDHDPGLGFVALARLTVEAGNAPRPTGIGVDQVLMRDRVGPNREIRGLLRRVE